MSASPSVAIIFHRLGPYHLARCVAAGSRCDLTVIELSSVDDTYAWSRVDGAPNFTRVTLFADEDVDRKRSIEIWRGMHRLLAAADPEVVAIPGWSHPGALAALLWCVLKGRRAVLMSDSAAHDAVRRRAWEATKQRVVRLFSSAVVAGAPIARTPALSAYPPKSSSTATMSSTTSTSLAARGRLAFPPDRRANGLACRSASSSPQPASSPRRI